MTRNAFGRRSSFGRLVAFSLSLMVALVAALVIAPGVALAEDETYTVGFHAWGEHYYKKDYKLGEKISAAEVLSAWGIQYTGTPTFSSANQNPNGFALDDKLNNEYINMHFTAAMASLDPNDIMIRYNATTVSPTGSCTLNTQVSSISVSPDSVTLTELGATANLTASIQPEDATHKEVTWSSSNESIATVNRSGNLTASVTAVAEGTATITATAVDGSGKTGTRNVTVTLTPHAVTVENDGNGTGTAAPSTAKQGEQITLTATPKDGYEFDKWESSDVKVENNKFTMLNKDVIVKAVFKKKPPTYAITVTADPAAGGTATADKATAAAGEIVTLTAKASNNYEFVGWEPVTKDVTIKDGKFTMIAGAVEVKGVFKKVKATLTFDLAGGNYDGNTDKHVRTETIGETIKLPKAPTRAGYVFKAWVGSEYAAEAEYKVEDDHTFTAKWAKLCTLTFDANGGKGEMSNMTVEEGETVTLNANKYTRDGYTFNGWNTKKDGSGKKFTDKQKVKLSSDVTLYAQWKKNTTSSSSSKSSTSSRSGLADTGDPASLAAVAAAALPGAALAAAGLRRRRG